MVMSSCTANSPEKALQEFYDNQGAEDALMDPLILAGESVVPLVVEKAKDRKMVKRRYAIGFLGNGAYKEALPVLEGILRDPSEEDYMRSDALRSIYMIDSFRGEEFAKEYLASGGPLETVSRDILEGKAYLKERRSYRQALMSKHD